MTIQTTARFERDVKYYVKSKKFFKIYEDIETVKKELTEGNLLGDKLEEVQQIAVNLTASASFTTS